MAAEDWLAGDSIPDDQEISITGVIKETEKAILFQDNDVSFWIPKSVIAYYDETEVVVPEWFEIEFIWFEIEFIKDATLDDFEEF